MGRDEIGNGIVDIARKKKEDNGIGEVVAAVETLGKRFLIMEKMMHMAGEVEQMRMRMRMQMEEDDTWSHKSIV
ncbi:Hypothetical predicted protein [Olea europaea subsp. europaea]|uniref:Uncharacterized protein n=1 Tax=Olea europaea subsp. europaea TaxID=158383 RepID=A0A8S0RLA7_OLEEU|nr:Hypothetical predicted protein [Olea europaea subsp. europaea]